MGWFSDPLVPWGHLFLRKSTRLEGDALRSRGDSSPVTKQVGAEKGNKGEETHPEPSMLQSKGSLSHALCP